jgi:hypothetical protein
MNGPSCLAENGASASICVRGGTTLSAPTSVVVTVDLSPGTLFHGRYEIQGPLGQGGMGMVSRRSSWPTWFAFVIPLTSRWSGRSPSGPARRSA